MADENTATAEQTTAQGDQTATQATTATTTATAANDDWRAAIKDPEAKKFAESSPDVEHLTRRAMEMRQKLSGAIVRPGKDAKPEEIAAYRKALGVPEKPDAYAFEMPEGQEAGERDKVFHTQMASLFHKADITAEQAKVLNKGWNDFVASVRQSEVDADKKFAEETEKALRSEWKGEEYERNKTYAERAMVEFAGEHAGELKNLQMKDGRFALDHPLMLRIFAAAGRMMGEDKIGSVLSETDRNAVQDKIDDLQKRKMEAFQSNDRDLANRLDAEQAELIRKTQGSRPIVGAKAA